MQYFYVKGFDEEDTPEVLMNLQKLNKEESVTIIINSNGGLSDIFDIIYRHLKDFTFTIDVYKAMSAGLLLLDKLSKLENCKGIYIDETSRFIAHIGAFELPYGDKGVIRGDLNKYVAQISRNCKSYHFDFLTGEEVIKYLNGDDVYIMPNRLIEYYNLKLNK